MDNHYYEGKQKRFEDSYSSYFAFTVNKDRTVVTCEAQNPYGIDTKTGAVTVLPGIVTRSVRRCMYQNDAMQCNVMINDAMQCGLTR